MMLFALVDYYEHLLAETDGEGLPGYGYSQEKIAAALVLGDGGELLDVDELREADGKKSRPRLLAVPQGEKRTAGIKPNLLWDKASYVLGVGGGRVQQEHEAFRSAHLDWLADTDDADLVALSGFLQRWRPEQFAVLPPAWQERLLAGNLVFRRTGARHYVHEAPGARALRARLLDEGGAVHGQCLVTGKEAPLARLHPSIKGVRDAQSSGASIVSFNLDAFTSYGKTQGDNAPVSSYAAFAYTTVLNQLLRPDSRQKLQVGDTALLFWAQGKHHRVCEDMMALWLGSAPDTDAQATAKLGDALQLVAQGRPLSELDPRLDEGTPFYVLGLAPNASRLSVRFWLPGTLGDFARRLAQHHADLALEPAPRPARPSAPYLALVTAPYRSKDKGGAYDADAVPPLLAGELLRAVFSGGRYPASLLAQLLMRLRSDGELSGTRVSLIKAVLERSRRLSRSSTQEEVPVSLDPQNRDPGYVLGRLFSALESAQRLALGDKVNATIRDRYYGAASSTPAAVFPLLFNGYRSHIGRLRKDKPGLAVTLEKEVESIVALLAAEFPRQLSLEAQGKFAIGYYHQRFQGKDENEAAATEAMTEGEQ